MARSRYESDEDLKHEWQVADEWESRFNVICTKLPWSYGADFACWRDGKVVGLIEVKRRNLTIDTHDTFMISERKRMECLRLGEYLGVPAVIVFKYKDGIYWADFSTERDFTEYGGRKKSDRDGQDIELMCHWVKSKFKRL